MKKLAVLGILAGLVLVPMAGAFQDTPFFWNSFWCTSDTTSCANAGDTLGCETALRAQDHESGNFFEGWWSFILSSGVDSAHVSWYDIRLKGTAATVVDSGVVRLYQDRDYIERIFADSVKLSIYDTGLTADIEVDVRGYQHDWTTWDGR